MKNRLTIANGVHPVGAALTCVTKVAAAQDDDADASMADVMALPPVECHAHAAFRTQRYHDFRLDTLLRQFQVVSAANKRQE